MRTLVATSPLLALLPLGASAAGPPPWPFGMSKAEVVSFKQLDPYKRFSNGDLETFNGILIRIGVRCGTAIGFPWQMWGRTQAFALGEFAFSMSTEMICIDVVLVIECY